MKTKDVKKLAELFSLSIVKILHNLLPMLVTNSFPVSSFSPLFTGTVHHAYFVLYMAWKTSFIMSFCNFNSYRSSNFSTFFLDKLDWDQTAKIVWSHLLKMTIFTLSQTTKLRIFQFKRVCRRQLQIWWKWETVLYNGRNHCGKRRNCSSGAISPFPTVFSKVLYWRHVKARACLGKG